MSKPPAGRLTATSLARPGFNGQLRENPQGWYHLGHGRRIHSPLLMRFHCPDRLSPFGAGGLNAYAYCHGDPLNFTDPTGGSIEGLFGMTYLLHALVEVVGVMTLLVPHLLLRAPPRSRRARYAAMKPDMATPIGGLNAFATGTGMVGSLVAMTATAVTHKDPESETLDGLMYTASSISIGVMAVKGVAYATPKDVPHGRGRKWAEFVHGKKAVRDAVGDPVPDREPPTRLRGWELMPQQQMQEIRSPASPARDNPPSSPPGASTAMPLSRRITRGPLERLI